MSMNYIGTRWKSRDKREDRTVTVVSGAATVGFERRWLIRNDRTGRQTNISMTMLRGKYDQIEESDHA